MKNKIKLLIFAIAFFAIAPIMNVQAATGRISVSASSNTVSVGNTVSVTVRCSSTSAIGTCEYSMNYDSSKLKMTSGEYSVVEPGNGSSKTITKYYKFKAIANGSSRISVSAYAIRDWTSEKAISTSVSGTTITAKTGGGSSSGASSNKPNSTTYSTNNYLSSLSISGATLSPTFKKDTLAYTVSLDESVEKITIRAKAEDSKANVSGTGEKNVTEGDNKFNIVVTSEKGTKRTYTITATVKDKNPINVSLDGSNYTVVKSDKALKDIPTYSKTKVKIDEIEVPALYSDITKFTLVGLKSKDGSVELYIYDENKNTYTLYNELTFDGLRFYPMATDKKLDGYITSEVTINDIKIDCFRLHKDSKYAVIYGMNVESGETGFYTYEESEGTIQKYTDEIASDYQNEIKKLKQFIVLLGGIILLLSIILIAVASIKTKQKAKSKKKNVGNEAKSFSEKTIVEDEQLAKETSKKKSKSKRKTAEKQLDNW